MKKTLLERVREIKKFDRGEDYYNKLFDQQEKFNKTFSKNLSNHYETNLNDFKGTKID